MVCVLMDEMMICWFVRLVGESIDLEELQQVC
jgi:hypothetical protein